MGFVTATNKYSVNRKAGRNGCWLASGLQGKVHAQDLQSEILGWASVIHYISALLAVAIFLKKNYLLLYIF